MKSFLDIIKSEKPTLVDFHAPWCGPCHAQSAVLDELSRSVRSRVKILKVDIERNPIVKSQFNVRSVPTLVLFQKGKIIWRHIGLAQLDELIQVVNYHHKVGNTAA